jgi:DNA-binding response OmpR family regulator
MTHPGSPDLRILLVEDDFLVGVQLEEDLNAAGHATLGPFNSLASAREAARSRAFDLAILDVNLRGEQVFPLADELIARGVPLILLTGYQPSDLPQRLRGLAHLPKPYDPAALARAIARLQSDSDL